MNNQIELIKTRKENLNKIDKDRGYHKYNCIRINPNNSYRHEKAKFDKGFELAKLNHKFMTEAKSANNERIFDCIDFDTGEIWEFETNPKIEKKGTITVRV